MSNCCTDPTEPARLDPRELLREQEHFGNLLRDLFTDNPEKVILRQLNSANTYLKELAALKAHHESVRKRAIELLEQESTTVLQRIIKQEPATAIGTAAQQRLNELASDDKSGALGKIFGKFKR